MSGKPRIWICVSMTITAIHDLEARMSEEEAVKIATESAVQGKPADDRIVDGPWPVKTVCFSARVGEKEV